MKVVIESLVSLIGVEKATIVVEDSLLSQYKWLAVDSDGEIAIFTDKPTLNLQVWDCETFESYDLEFLGYLDIGRHLTKSETHSTLTKLS